MAMSLCESFEGLLLRQKEISGVEMSANDMVLTRAAFFFGSHCALTGMLDDSWVEMVREINQEAIETVRRALRSMEDLSR